ncbi:MAG: rhomboid family intramembrane serine protease, partial [Planctomycetota bacterium]|nr:rhomboid family intramembrane serine protease [Planctomycetota bacterium]
MLIPLRTNRTPKRRPRVTELLIIVNLLVYLAGLVAEYGGVFDRATMIDWGHLGRTDFNAWGLITYQFLHDPRDLLHLAFNMLFLWVFGGAVEDRLGRANYLAFYLIGGAVAGVAHMMISPAPVIGASGSIAGVTGAFLALFPRSRIQVLLFFFIIGLYSIPSLWFIGFYFFIDLLRQTTSLLGGGGGNVAYMAHIAGYLYGFILAFLLLALRIVKREEFDVFFLFQQSRRRAAFRSASHGKLGGMWESASADTGKQIARKARKTAPPPPQDEKTLAARAEINRLIAEHDLPAAAAAYRKLLDEGADVIFSEQRQLDLANQLQAEEDYERAANAYERLLKAYPSSGSAAEVRLILGLLYVRRLNRPEGARALLERARGALSDEGQRALADQLLA